MLDADWTLLQGTQSNPVLRRSVHLTAPAGGSAQGEAAAMSTLLGQLADDTQQSARAPPALTSDPGRMPADAHSW